MVVPNTVTVVIGINVVANPVFIFIQPLFRLQRKSIFSVWETVFIIVWVKIISFAVFVNIRGTVRGD
jgi:hypothetical protein